MRIVGKGRKLLAALLVFMLLTSPPSSAVAAPQWLKDLGRATVEYVVVKEYFKYIDAHWGNHFLGEYRAAYGVSRDPSATAMLERVSGRIVASVRAREGIRSPFAFFVNSQQGINAFRGLGNVVSLNHGLFSGLNWHEDEVAFIVAHEVGHGQGQHFLRSLDKILGVQLIAGIYAAKNNNDLSAILTWCATRLIVAKAVTLPQEWDADNRAFDYAVAAGYNPGAGAAGFVRVRAKYGEPGRNILGELISPSDHPTNSQRIANFAAKMTGYGRGNVTVDRGVILVRGKPWFTPVGANGQYAEERAYLIAGNLARAYHDPATPLAATVENGAVIMGGRVVLTQLAGEPAAAELADAINAINGV